MNHIMLVFILAFFSLNSFSQARKPDIKIKKSTDVVKHDAYTSIYATSYRNLETSYGPKLFEHGCMFKASLSVIKEPGLFRKGEHRGSFEASCYNPKIKDINLFFAVYPYDDESDSVLEIVFKTGKSLKLYDCWDHNDGSSRDCSHLKKLDPSEYNFKTAPL